jgi:hypothetical protein
MNQAHHIDGPECLEAQAISTPTCQTVAEVQQVVRQGLSATDLCGTIQAIPDPPRQLSFPRWLFDPFAERSPA